MNKAQIRDYACNLKFDTTLPIKNPYNLSYPGTAVKEVHILPKVIGDFLSMLNHLGADENADEHKGNDKNKALDSNELSAKQLATLIYWIDSKLGTTEYEHLQQIREFLAQLVTVES